MKVNYIEATVKYKQPYISLSASVKVPLDKLNPGGSQDAGETKKVVLNSSDALFAELRDKNFNAVGSIVSKKAKHITAEFDVSDILKNFFLKKVCDLEELCSQILL